MGRALIEITEFLPGPARRRGRHSPLRLGCGAGGDPAEQPVRHPGRGRHNFLVAALEKSRESVLGFWGSGTARR